MSSRPLELSADVILSQFFVRWQNYLFCHFQKNMDTNLIDDWRVNSNRSIINVCAKNIHISININHCYWFHINNHSKSKNYQHAAVKCIRNSHVTSFIQLIRHFYFVSKFRIWHVLLCLHISADFCASLIVKCKSFTIVILSLLTM